MEMRSIMLYHQQYAVWYCYITVSACNLQVCEIFVSIILMNINLKFSDNFIHNCTYDVIIIKNMNISKIYLSVEDVII